MQEDIIKKINETAPYLSPEDLDEWIVPSLISFYDSKVNSLAYRAYGVAGSSLSPIAKRAFFERAKAEIREGLNTFLFKSEHWRNGRDINTYLLTCLNRLAERIKWDSESIKKVNFPICPGCKSLGKKEFLVQESKTWTCPNCLKETSRLEEEISLLKNNINRSDNENIILTSYESIIILHKVFSIHSRSGVRCPDCNRFIPISSNGTFGISCPYRNCSFFGNAEKLEKMPHPLGMSSSIDLSLDTPASSESNKIFLDFYAAENINSDVEIETKEQLKQELDTLLNVIDDQVDFVKRTNSAGTMMQKLLMYEAYQNMLKKYPEDMISYLVHRKQSAEFPIQARIFQEYASLMEEALPYSIIQGNNTYDIVSLTDPNIQLFDGISEFEAFVRSDNTIPNNTTETYTGGRKFKYYGPCFLGMLIDVIDLEQNISIKDKVDNYSFVQIKMLPEIKPKASVKVKHFRIIPHYEMGGLVYLQRIRKKIVDSVYLRQHGKKRTPRK